MHRVLVVCLLVLSAGFTAAQSSAPTSGTHSSVFTTAHRTTHRIAEATIIESARSCSATAIAAHALLTASHCELPTSAIEVDGSVMEIQGVERDGYDHTIYEVSGTFKNWATFSSVLPVVGDDIFLFGNPGDLSDILRKGYIAKAPLQNVSVFQRVMLGPVVDQVTFDFNGFFGDSGAAIFNTNGEIIGVVSQIESQHNTEPDGAVSQNLMLGYSIHFTSEQLTATSSFTPHKVSTNLNE